MQLPVSNRTFRVIHLHHPFVLDIDLTSVGAFKTVFDQLIGILRNVDPACSRICLHPGRDIDRISPYVKGKLLGSHYAPDDRSGIDSDANIKMGNLVIVRFALLLHEIDNLKSCIDHLDRLQRTR